MDPWGRKEEFKMSERAKREATLEKIQEMYPETASGTELTALVVAADKKAETVSGIKWIVSGIAIFAVGFALTKTLSVWLLLAMVAIVANGIRLMMNGPRIEQRYREEPLPEEGGDLTRERIEADCAKGLKVTDGRFYIVRAPLHDMSVDSDTGFFQLFSHRFFFRSPDGIYSLAVKREQYRTAALEAEYYVVFPKSERFRDQVPVRAYQADSWTLSQELEDCIGDFPELPRGDEAESPRMEGRKKILPILSIALSFLAMWVNVSVMPILCLGGLALAVIGVMKEKNSWTTGAMTISIMSIAVMLMFVVPSLIRG